MLLRVPVVLTSIVIGFASVASAIDVPAGFYVIAEHPGVIAYQKDYTGGQPDFVVVVDLREARLDSLTGPIVDPGSGAGPLGGDNPSITRQSLETFWDQAVAEDPTTHAVVNGQFFAMTGTNAPLAFSVHQDGDHVSDGYGITSEYPGQILLFEVDNGSHAASIVPFDATRFHRDGGADVRVAGLTTDADKGPNNFTGRTFIGILDDDGDGVDETVLIFSTTYTRQPDAEAVLSDFGARAQVMFDGGGSSQLIVDGVGRVNSDRTIPHIFAARELGCDDTCTPGAGRCAPDRERCEVGGDGCASWQPAPCGADERCVDDGVCERVASCDDRCDLADPDRCAGLTIEACSADAEGCLDWRATGTCEVACEAGTCVSTEDVGVDTGAEDTGVADTGIADTGIADTGSADTTEADTSAADTLEPDTAADTETTDTGAADTDPADAPAPSDTRPEDTESSGDAAAPTVRTAETGCGCTSSPRATGPWWIALGLALGISRRRRRAPGSRCGRGSRRPLLR